MSWFSFPFGADSGSSNPGGGVPPGTLLDFAAATPPSGYILCDGSAISRTVFAGLFGAIGTTWGAGDGSTTFNVPDLRGRAAIGSGTGAGLTSRTLGTQNIGEETHLLVVGELPSHNHVLTDPGHSHAQHSSTLYFLGPSDVNVGSPTFSASTQALSTASATTGITLANTGGGSAHNVMQPSYVVTKIIKF